MLSVTWSPKNLDANPTRKEGGEVVELPDKASVEISVDRSTPFLEASAVVVPLAVGTPSSEITPARGLV